MLFFDRQRHVFMLKGWQLSKACAVLKERWTRTLQIVVFISGVTSTGGLVGREAEGSKFHGICDAWWYGAKGERCYRERVSLGHQVNISFLSSFSECFPLWTRNAKGRGGVAFLLYCSGNSTVNSRMKAILFAISILRSQVFAPR